MLLRFVWLELLCQLLEWNNNFGDSFQNHDDNQEYTRWSLNLPWKPFESTLSAKKTKVRLSYLYCILIVSDSSWFANLVDVIYVISFARGSILSNSAILPTAPLEFSAYRKYSGQVREVIFKSSFALWSSNRNRCVSTMTSIPLFCSLSALLKDNRFQGLNIS